MKLICTLALAVLIGAIPAFGQSTPAPTVSTTNFSLGGQAMGIGGGTPAVDVNMTLNPGLVGKAQNFELRSDNIEAPGANTQIYLGGGNYLPPAAFPVSSILHPLKFYIGGGVGVDRIVPAAGPSQAHIAFMVGGGARWLLSSGVQINLFEVDWLRAPGSPWGNNTAAISGKLSYAWGKR